MMDPPSVHSSFLEGSSSNNNNNNNNDHNDIKLEVTVQQNQVMVQYEELSDDVDISENTITLVGDELMDLKYLPLPNGVQFSRVELKLHADFVSLSEEHLQQVERLITECCGDAIRSINIERAFDAESSFTVAALNRLLQLPNMKHLTDLRVLGTRLQGTKEEWRLLAETFCQNLIQLNFLCMVEPLSWLEHIPEGVLDPLVRVLAAHSPLRFVATNYLLTCVGTSTPTVELLCQSPHIMGFHLVDIDYSEERMLTFFNAMRQNQDVWFLCLSMTKRLQQNHGQALAKMIQENNALRHLNITTRKGIFDDRMLKIIAQGLQSNSSIQDFSWQRSPARGVYFREYDSGAATAIVNMLHKNVHLQALEFSGLRFHSPIPSIVDMYLRLNKAGRRHLLIQQQPNAKDAKPSSQTWIQVLSNEHVNDQLDCLYHLLSLNPELIFSNTSCCCEEPARSESKRDHPLPPDSNDASKKRKLVES